MNFSAWSIRNPIAPILLFAILMVLGWQSFTKLPITRFPNIDVPLVAVSVAQSGAAPGELESQVTKQIEDAVAGITGVKSIQSTVTDGSSSTVAEFRMEVPTDRAVQDVKDAIDQIRGDLPASIEAPIVTRIDVEGQAIMTFGVSSPQMSIEELSWFVEDVVKRGLQGRTGIGKIERYGGADREIRIELDPVKLGSFGITATSVSQQLRATNADLGAGRGEIGSGEQAIRVLGDAASARDLAQTTIALPSGRFVKLGDLGTVSDSFEELRSFSTSDGNSVVSFAVFRASGASEVTVAETTNAVLEDIRAAHPGVTITKLDDTVGYTEGNYEAAMHTLLEGAFLAVLVVLLFLRNWRATLIAAIALPLSAVPTFLAMDLMGFSLNLVSLLAITLATGILVDDAIVEVENISRHIGMGKTPYRAAIDAADEIGLAVIATTATIVVVFLPVSFMPGIPGQYFMQFGLTVAFSVTFSLLVARLITPMMAAYLMRDSDAEKHQDRDGWIMRLYTGLIRTTLRFRYFTLMGALGALAVSLYFMLQIPGSFMPTEDVSRVSVSIELPPGSTLEDTQDTTDRIGRAVQDIDGVLRVVVAGGSSPTGQLDVRRASVTILLDPLDASLERKLLDIVEAVPVLGTLVPDVAPHGRIRPQTDIEREIFERLATIPDIRAFKLNDRGARDISYSILSDNDADLNAATVMLEQALASDPLLENVGSEGALPRPEVQVTPYPEIAARLGITTTQIAETVRVATIGDVDAALAKISLDDRQIPVRVRLSDRERDDIARIGATKIVTAAGDMVPLNAVAEIRLADGPSVINRLNRERLVTIGASLPAGVALETATSRFEEVMNETALPPSVRLAEAGDAEIQQELLAGFANAMILALMMMLGVLILLFNSVLQPLTILLSLPLAIGGVAAGLILTGNSVSMPVLIGLLMLMGIVAKNAILLVDFSIEMISRGLSRTEAMVEAGRKRARPIVMTSLAMSAGMLPSALGVGEGGSFRAPMAIAVIGGIIVSTVLSLVIVPSFSLIMGDVGRPLAWLFGRFIGPREAEPKVPDNATLDARLARAEAEADRLRDRLATVSDAIAPPMQPARAAE